MNVPFANSLSEAEKTVNALNQTYATLINEAMQLYRISEELDEVDAELREAVANMRMAAQIVRNYSIGLQGAVFED